MAYTVKPTPLPRRISIALALVFGFWAIDLAPLLSSHNHNMTPGLRREHRIDYQQCNRQVPDSTRSSASGCGNDFFFSRTLLALSATINIVHVQAASITKASAILLISACMLSLMLTHPPHSPSRRCTVLSRASGSPVPTGTRLSTAHGLDPPI